MQICIIVQFDMGRINMILYKYYGYEAGLKALESQQLGFRNPINFNDPFELSFLSNSDGADSKRERLKEQLNKLRDTVAILSLTRTPNNPLMWAHYGEDHTGFVIGYDVSDVFLSSQKYNLIPVTAGDVVYTNTKSSHILNPQIMDRIHQIYLSAMGDSRAIHDPETIALARKIFLTKHSSWVYEEEVRVVKILDSLFEESAVFQSDERRSYYHITEAIKPGFCNIKIPGLSIFNFKVPIKQVYLGVRNEIIDKPNEIPVIENARYFNYSIDDKSWNLISSEIEMNKP